LTVCGWDAIFYTRKIDLQSIIHVIRSLRWMMV
jgi:hypothetical protein